MYQSFRDLVVWQQSYDFAKNVYALSRELPDEHLYTFRFQLVRAALAIPSHVAQGQTVRGKKFLAQLESAAEAAAETETYLLLVADLMPELAVKAQILREQNAVIQKMLSALTFALSQSGGKTKAEAVA